MAFLKKVLILVAVGLLLTVYVNGADDNAASESHAVEEDENASKTYKRLIPADVLRGSHKSYFYYY